MSSVAELIAQGAAALAAAKVESPRAEARLLLEAATGTGRARLLAHPERAVAESDAERYLGWVSRRALREPTAYILGRAEFWGLGFAVGPGVLIPRADSETMIEAVIRAFPDRSRVLRVLDLGVGSGCLLLSVLHHFVNARGLGIDASTQALAYARSNAEALGVDARAKLRLADWRDGLSGTFDIVLVNPPYIATAEIETLEPEVRCHEPREALDGGADGLDAYRSLCPTLCSLLDPDGSAFIEIGAGQVADVASMHVPGMGSMRIHRDLAGIDRCVEFRPWAM